MLIEEREAKLAEMNKANEKLADTLARHLDM